jgi:hypothetical protein
MSSSKVGRPIDTARELARKTNSMQLVHVPPDGRLIAAICGCGWELIGDVPELIASATERHLRDVHHVNVVSTRQEL